MAVGLMSVTVIGMIANSFAWNPIRFQCKNYVANSYLYLMLAGLIIGTVLISLRFNFACDANAPIKESKSSQGNIFMDIRTTYLDNTIAIVMVGLCIICATGILFLPKTYFWSHHALFLMFTVFLGVSIYPLFDIFESHIRKLFYTTLFIIGVFGLLTTYKGDIFPQFSSTVVKVVTLIVTAGTITEGIEALLIWKHGIERHYIVDKIIHIAITAGVILIAFFDSQRIVKNAATCVSANYIQESLHHIIDTLKIVFFL
jgi:hypothetical protein